MIDDKNISIAHKIASAVHDAGGRTYFVGGYVRDKILGLNNKDIDIEVHGITPQTLNSILDSLGERITLGDSFSVLGLRHYELDVSMPHSMASEGRGSKDFTDYVEPFIGAEKAARRRDFTMNALMQDVLTGEILDFFGGIDDIHHKIIRHVNDASFVQDPLRVFRAAQFAARFGFSIAEETTALCSCVDVSSLPNERIMLELEKSLLRSQKPSVFFEALRRMQQLSVWFPELASLDGLAQDSNYHPEGDVWQHTMQVLDAAAEFREQAKRPLWLMLAALCHDFGKAITTTNENGHIHSYKHESEGLPLVEKFLLRLTNEAKLIDYVMDMTMLHMQPNANVIQHSTVKAFMKMFDRTSYPEDLLLLVKADYLGRTATTQSRGKLLSEYETIERSLHEMLKIYHERMTQPYVTGRDLIEAGFEAGPLMGEALDYVHRLRLAGIPKDEQFKHAASYMRRFADNE